MRAMFKLILRLTDYLVMHTSEKTLSRYYFLQDLKCSIKFEFCYDTSPMFCKCSSFLAVAVCLYSFILMLTGTCSRQLPF